jgi:hypothetical protein
MDRRRFVSSIAGLTASLFCGDIAILASKTPLGEQEFVIIDGWVLTREDVGASEVTSDVIRL